MGRTQLVIILVGIILLLLSLSSLKIRLQYRRQGNDDFFALKLSLLSGLISYKLEVPMFKTEFKHGFRPWRWPFWTRILRPALKIEAKVTGKDNQIKEEELIGLPRIISIIKKSIGFFLNYMPAIRYFLGRVHLRRFQWMTEFGMEEPHSTGFLVGLAGGLKGLLISKLYRVIHTGAAKPMVIITPKFGKPCFATQIDCEFDITIGYIFLASLKFILTKLKG